MNKYYERPFIISLLPELKGKVFVDAGCGAGYFSLYAQDKGANVIALDISDRMLYLVNKANPNIETHKFDMEKRIDFSEKESVDIIVSSLVLHYVNDWTNFIESSYDVLKKGGKLILSFNHPVYSYVKNIDNPYFDKKIVSKVWKVEPNSFTVESYVRPLGEVMGYILNKGFSEVNIYEPRPEEKYKEELGKKFERLDTKPSFMFVELIK